MLPWLLIIVASYVYPIYNEVAILCLKPTLSFLAQCQQRCRLFNYLFRRLCNLVFWQVDYNSNGVLDALEVEVTYRLSNQCQVQCWPGIWFDQGHHMQLAAHTTQPQHIVALLGRWLC